MSIPLGQGRARGNVDEPPPSRRMPKSDITPRPRQGISVLGYRLVGHRPGKPADKTSDPPPTGCLPRIKDYLPFKLKKLEQVSAGTSPTPEAPLAPGTASHAREGKISPDEARSPEEQEEPVEWHDALETQEWAVDEAPHRDSASPTVMNPEDAVAEGMGKARREPMTKVVVGLRHAKPMGQDEGIRPSTTDSHLTLRYRKDAAKQRWLDIETNRRGVPAAQTLGPFRSKAALVRAAVGEIEPLLTGMSAEAPSVASSSPGVHIVGPPRKSGLSETQVRLIGVARWPDPQYNQEDSVISHWYGGRFHRDVRHAASRIASGQIANFRQLWTFASDARYEWAKIRNDDERLDFASKYPRAHKAMTPLDWRYEYLAKRLDSEQRSGQRRMAIEGGVFSDISDPDFAAHRVFQAKDMLGGQEIELTTLRIAVNPSDFDDEDVQDFREKSPCPRAFPAAIQHTAPENIAPVMNHVESIFGDLVRTPRPPAKLMEALADVHWWMSHAMPDSRGSAAKTEMAVRAMAAAHGIELPPFKHGIVPDMEAFATDRASFRATYVQMFEGPISAASPAEPVGSP